MAAVSRPPGSARRPTDPFKDPPSASIHQPKYRNPTRAVPAPKAMSTAKVQQSANHRDITEAVRDTVQVRGPTDYRSGADPNPRNKMGRSQTTHSPAANPSRPATTPSKRSQSQDSVLVAAAAVEKAKRDGKPRSKKGSQHADVIDRLDFTGVGPMFHHDGPFDACAPSRNRQKNKAPMLAWTARADQIPREYTDSAYPSPATAVNSQYRDPYEPAAPKKKVDAIAEAWGIHEPEPFEDFSAGGGRAGDTPASSIYNGKDSHTSHSTANSARSRRTKDGREAREAYRDLLDEGQASPAGRSRAARRSTLPPPQPIFVPDGENAEQDGGVVVPGTPTGAATKRSKSLMHRIRKMRDNPNVPVGDSENGTALNSVMERTASDRSASVDADRPTHRHQNSFLGRFGNRGNNPQTPAAVDMGEPFILVEDTNNPNGVGRQNKDLPAPPAARTPTGGAESSDGYFSSGGAAEAPTTPGGGIGRKTSLMRKVGRVVRGNK